MLNWFLHKIFFYDLKNNNSQIKIHINITIVLHNYSHNYLIVVAINIETENWKYNQRFQEPLIAHQVSNLFHIVTDGWLID